MFQEHALTIASYLNNSRAAVLLSAVEILEEQEIKLDGRKKPRTSRARVNYYQTLWAKSLEEVEKLEDQSTVEADLFRLRFRLPYPLFKPLLSWTKFWREKSSQNPKGIGAFDATGNPRVPNLVLLEFKLEYRIHKYISLSSSIVLEHHNAVKL